MVYLLQGPGRTHFPGKETPPQNTSTNMHEQSPHLEGAEDLHGENKCPTQEPQELSQPGAVAHGVGTLG